MKTQFTPIIGLEIHVEPKTVSKMFCGCSADYFGGKPNSHLCPVCLGLPGALPVPNQSAVDKTILLGLALGCSILENSKFDRKHYFYPDLVKGYQISQYDEPVAVHGNVTILNKELQSKTYRIRRVHLEEDTGKLLHTSGKTEIDFNRSGVPLIEIVTEPDFRSSDEVKLFLEELQVIIRTLGISDADMEKGVMRLEPNISLATEDQMKKNEYPPYKVEVKNINSFRFVKQAVEYEIERHQELLSSGNVPEQETRGFDASTGSTVSQRSKENAHDYRYFPEPNIPPLFISQEKIKKIREGIPELPIQKLKKYQKDLGVKYHDAFLLSRDVKVSQFFELAVSRLKSTVSSSTLAQDVANVMVNKRISIENIEEFLLKMNSILQPEETDKDAVKEVVIEVISRNEKAVSEYKKGKINVLMFLLGQVMREMKGKADAQVIKKVLLEILGS